MTFCHLIGSLRMPYEKNEALFETKKNWRCFFEIVNFDKVLLS